MADDPSLYNAGSAQTREVARAEAQARATLIGRAVGVYEHVGGTHPKAGRVAAAGHFMWRDVTDAAGTPYGVPKFTWREVEQVQP